MSVQRRFRLTVVVEAEREEELPSAHALVEGMQDGLPEAWFDPEEGDEFAITQMTGFVDDVAQVSDDAMVSLLVDAEALVVDLFEAFDMARGHDDEDAIEQGEVADDVLDRIRAALRAAGDHREATE
jgi:hypothetical protein